MPLFLDFFCFRWELSNLLWFIIVFGLSLISMDLNYLFCSSFCSEAESKRQNSIRIDWVSTSTDVSWLFFQMPFSVCILSFICCLFFIWSIVSFFSDFVIGLFHFFYNFLVSLSHLWINILIFTMISSCRWRIITLSDDVWSEFGEMCLIFIIEDVFEIKVLA